MPNNSNARREKDKKRQSKKKKKTDPPPLHKDDKASMDSSSLSLSLAGKDKASMDSSSSSLSLAGTHKANMDSNSLSLSGTGTTTEPLHPAYADLKETTLLLEFFGSLTLEKRRDMRKKIQESNPGASEEDIKAIFCTALLDAAHQFGRRKSQDEKDSSLSSPLIGKDKEDGVLSLRGQARKALIEEFNLSHTEREQYELFMAVKDANPEASAKELGKALRVASLSLAIFEG